MREVQLADANQVCWTPRCCLAKKKKNGMERNGNDPAAAATCLPARLLAAAALVPHLAYALHAGFRPANPLFSGSLSPCILQLSVAAIALPSLHFVAARGPRPHVRTGSEPSPPSACPSLRPSFQESSGKREGGRRPMKRVNRACFSPLISHLPEPERPPRLKLE